MSKKKDLKMPIFDMNQPLFHTIGIFLRVFRVKK